MPELVCRHTLREVGYLGEEGMSPSTPRGPTMPRPTSPADLPDWQRRTQTAFFQVDEISTDPELLRLFADYIAVTKQGGGDVEQLNSTVTCHRVRTHDEVATALDSAQTLWDRWQRDYDAIFAGEMTSVPENAKYHLRAHATREGLPRHILFADESVETIRDAIR